MSDNSVYIVGACRTPIGTFCGAFQNTPAHELGAVVIKEALKRAKVDPNDVNEVIMGQALTAGQGQNPVRVAALKAGVPISVPAFGISMLCGSGLKSVYQAYQSIVSGENTIVVAGGQENMTLSPHTILLRQGIRLGQGTMEDSLLNDGLLDAIEKKSMGETAEYLAMKYNVSRQIQDEFALHSQLVTEKSLENGYFKDEIVGVSVKKGRNEQVLITEDEYPKRGTTIEKLERLRPAFAKGDNASVTAGNASGINDGAAVVVLATADYCTQHNLTKLVRIVAFAQGGLELMEMGLGPNVAVPIVLKKAKWDINEVDLFELNEAFAVQSHLCIEKLGIKDWKNKVNVAGGAIALGHPIGASGARVLVTLIHNMIRLNKAKGVASLCIGGGMGIAIAVERNVQ